MNRISISIIALLTLCAFGAYAAPKIPAAQVSVDPALLSHSSSTTAQAVLKDLDSAIPGSATTTTPGTVRFATPTEVTAGTSTVTVVSPASLKSRTGMKFSPISAHSSVNVYQSGSSGTFTYPISGFSGSGLIPANIHSFYIRYHQHNNGQNASATLNVVFPDGTSIPYAISVVSGAAGGSQPQTEAWGCVCVPVNAGQPNLVLSISNGTLDFTIFGAEQVGE